MLRVSPAERSTRVRLNSELAVLDDAQFFIRCVLQVPIVDSESKFDWGVWVQVSEQDFMSYAELAGEEVPSFPYEATLANALPFYPECLGSPVKVHCQGSTQRPRLEPTSATERLAAHFRAGVPQEEARACFELVMHPQRH
jgi:hypothetical protein